MLTIPVLEVLYQGQMQNTINCLLNVECSPLTIKSKALRGTLLLYSVWYSWADGCRNEFAITACHPRASSRFIANLNEKRLQRKR